jgi:hypothetical protein
MHNADGTVNLAKDSQDQRIAQLIAEVDNEVREMNLASDYALYRIVNGGNATYVK